MHEMSLAMNIVELVCEKARAAEAEKITSIDLEVGDLSGVLADSLAFCFEAAAKSTLAEGALLNINRVAGQGKCLACGNLFVTDSLVSQCPRCGDYVTEIVQGRELRVSSLIVDE